MFQKAKRRQAEFTFLALAILAAQNAQNIAYAQTSSPESPAAPAEKMATAPKLSKAQRIALAVSAGPAQITKGATISDMPGMPGMTGEQPAQLREGTNGWVCYASTREPMCLDKQWQNWAKAWMGKTEPKIEGTGIAYMLRGDNGASNTDPWAKKPTADNEWVVSPAHIMLLFEDKKMLDSYPTDPKNGGPWVMWKGTPYAHLMVPVSPTKAVTMSSK
jgi:hypothetical protein